MWARRGSRPRKPRDSRYAWAYLFGAVCPERATGAALVMPYADTDAMTKHLAEISVNVRPGAHALLVADQAGWHGSEDLSVPDNITLLPLPSASPELNPQENVWEWMRKNKLALRVFEGYDQIVEACCQAWNDFIADADRVRSITSRQWAKAVNI